MNRSFYRRACMTSISFALSSTLFGSSEVRAADVPATSITGTLRARIADYDDHSEKFYRLVTADGREISLDFGGKAPGAGVGAQLTVRGAQVGNRIAVDSFDVLPRDPNEAKQQAQPSPGEPRVLKIAMINTDPSVTKEMLETSVKSADGSPVSFYRDNSYGAWDMKIDVFGTFPYTVGGCSTDDDFFKIGNDIRALAAAGGVDLNGYDNVMFYLTKPNSCSWSGLAEVGVNPLRGFKNAINSWYNASRGCTVLAQELAHNFGLLHSHSCLMGPPYENAEYGGTACAGYSEYGDLYTPMGRNCGHFNAPEMGAMQFIGGCNTLVLAGSGTFEIGPLEAKCAGAQVLRVPGVTMANQGLQYIYAEYRKGKGNVPSDTTSLNGVYIRASAEYGGHATTIPNAPNHDLDWAVDPFYLHAPLGMGESWTEPTSGATFTVVSIGDTAKIQVTLADGGAGGPAKCIDGNDAPPTPMCTVLDGGVPQRDGGTTDAGAAADASRDAGATGTGGADAGTTVDAGSAGTGTSGAGGAGGSGTAGTAGTAGTGGSNDDGCGCSVPGGTSKRGTAALLLGLAAAIPVLRRRSRRLSKR